MTDCLAPLVVERVRRTPSGSTKCIERSWIGVKPIYCRWCRRFAPLQWKGVPDAAASVVLVVEDADSPTRHPLVPAIAYDLSGDRMQRGALSNPRGIPVLAQMGRNSFLTARYLPPPIRRRATVRTDTRLRSLRSTIVPSLRMRQEAARLAQNMRDHVVAKGVLCGLYERKASV